MEQFQWLAETVSMMIQDVPGAGMILLSPVRQNVLSLDVPVAFYLLIVSRIDVIILILTLLFCLFSPHLILKYRVEADMVSVIYKTLTTNIRSTF